MNSRIKRRNKFGYKGVGNYVGIPEHQYGDYRDLAQNNKIKNKNLHQMHLINLAKKQNIKHPGSKKIKILTQYEIT